MVKNHIYIGCMFFVLIALILGGCSKEDTVVKQRLEEKVGQESVEQLADPRQVSAGKPVKNQDNKYVIASERHVLSANETDQLKKMLLNEKGYIFDKTKKCLFIPEIAFSFLGHESETLVMVNLFGNQIKVDDGTRSVILDYDPMAPKMNAFCRDMLEQLEK